MTVRVRDLPENAQGVFQYCPRCGARYSATKGDYFLFERETVLTCQAGHKRTNVILAREECEIVEVRA